MIRIPVDDERKSYGRPRSKPVLMRSARATIKSGMYAFNPADAANPKPIRIELSNADLPLKLIRVSGERTTAWTIAASEAGRVYHQAQSASVAWTIVNKAQSC